MIGLLLASLILAIQPMASGEVVFYDNGKYERQWSDTFETTMYTLDPSECGKLPSDPWYGITASGMRVKSGRTVAVDTSVIKLGTLIRIETFGFRRAEDTGGAVEGNSVDIYTELRSTAFSHGRKDLKVTIYKKVVPNREGVE